MSKLKNNKTALIIIDVQNFYWSKETHEEYIANLQRILEDARRRKLYIIHVKHVWGDNPEDKIFDIREEITPLTDEPIVIKHEAGAFYQTNLEELLKSRGIEDIFITGMQTHLCCDTTTREASTRGYNTTVIKEGVRTFDIKGIDGEMIPRETIQYVTLSILQAFGTCISTEEFLQLENE